MTIKESAVSVETLKSISTPDQVESRLGMLEFDDGAPSEATAALLYDNLDFQHGVQALQPFFDKTWQPSEIEQL